MFRFARSLLNNNAAAKVATLPSVNCVNLVGVAHDVQAGYVGTDLILQFQLVCNYLPVVNEQVPIINPLVPSSSTSTSNTTTSIEREYFTVRVSGNLDEVKTQLHDGSVVSLQGQFKMNMQPEPLADHRMMPFPYIAVKLPSSTTAEGESSSGCSETSTDFVEILHGKGVQSNSTTSAVGKSTTKK